MIAEGEDGSGDWRMGEVVPEYDTPVPEVKSVEKSDGEVPDRFSLRGGSQRIGQVHVRRMREISGREIKWRAR